MIKILCEDARNIDWPDADVCMTDPPWAYRRRAVRGNAADQYDGLTCAEIRKILEPMPARRLVMWCTWPLLGGWVDATAGWSWGPPKTGGAWSKSMPGNAGHFGPGFHWAGCSELVLVYVRKGCHIDRSVPVRNSWVERPAKHSRKPVEWQAMMLDKWCPPGGLVLDPFVGLGSVPEAVARSGGGRRFLGTEIDESRHAEAVRLASRAGGAA